MSTFGVDVELTFCRGRLEVDEVVKLKLEKEQKRAKKDPAGGTSHLRRLMNKHHVIRCPGQPKRVNTTTFDL